MKTNKAKVTMFEKDGANYLVMRIGEKGTGEKLWQSRIQNNLEFKLEKCIDFAHLNGYDAIVAIDEVKKQGRRKNGQGKKFKTCTLELPEWIIEELKKSGNMSKTARGILGDYLSIVDKKRRF
jgi:hypothetical protein